MSESPRIGWDDYFLNICAAVAQRSIDQETQVGCVIVNAQRRVVSTGYNSFPAGVDDSFWPRDRGTRVKVPYVGVERCDTTGPPSQEPLAQQTAADPRLEGQYRWRAGGRYYEVDKYAAMTHAELNAIVAAGQDLHGCTLYTQLFPCHECAKAIITAGIRRLVYAQTREDVSWAVAKELCIQAGVELVGPAQPCRHDRQAASAMGALTGVWRCKDCGTTISTKETP